MNDTKIQKICAFCEETFPVDAIKDHIRINHLGIESSDDDTGSKSLENEIKRELLENLKNKCPKCNMCNIRFPNKTCYREHLHNVHFIKETTAKLRCDTCRQEFTNLTELKSHKRSHDIDKMNGSHRYKNANLKQKVKCDVCYKEFPDRSGLRKHKKYVHDKVKVNCDKCDKSFSGPGGLSVHRKKFHWSIWKFEDFGDCVANKKW